MYTVLENAPQGSAAWHAARAQRFCASEAAAALGAHKFTTRSELLKQKATGIVDAEVDAATLARFAAGHAAEAAARPIAEAITGEELAPVVCVLDYEGLPLLASMDGLDFMGDVSWENKLSSRSLVAQVQAGELEPHYWAQLEHGLLVSGAERALFTASDGTEEGTHHLWYTSRPERRAQVIAAWKQFAIDLAAYTPEPPKAAPVVAAPQETLPAVSVRVDGQLAIVSNLPAFGAALQAFIDRIPAEPSTDQEFVDTEAACKALKRAEDALEAAESNALAQLADVDTMRRLVADYRALARTTRLQREKLVALRKNQLRDEIVAGAQSALRVHVDALNQRLGGNFMPCIVGDFGGVIKGLKSLDSMRDKAATELARVKIAANEDADRIDSNLKLLAEHSGHAGLFPDVGALVLKTTSDLRDTITARIAAFEAKERSRLEAERERIAAEERAKAEAAAAPAAPAVAQALEVASAPAASQPPAGAVPTLRIGAIAERLGWTMTAEQLRALGIEPAGRERGATLYHEHQFPAICRAIARRAMEVSAAHSCG